MENKINLIIAFVLAHQRIIALAHLLVKPHKNYYNNIVEIVRLYILV